MENESVLAGETFADADIGPERTDPPQMQLPDWGILPRRQAMTTALAFEGGLGLLAIGLAWPLGVDLLASCKVSQRHLLSGIAAIAPMLALFAVCLAVKLPALRAIRRLLDDNLPRLFGSCTSLDLALVSVAAGIGEELFFRGLLQAKLSAWFGADLGLLAASAAFGLAHCVTTTYMLLTFVIGAYLGWLFQSTGSLMPPIVAHGLYDWLALMYLLKWRRRSET